MSALGAMLERTEAMPEEQLMKLHGVLRGLRPVKEEPMNEWEWQLLEEKTSVDHLEIGGVEVKAGSRVRLRPRKGGDVMDIALAGQIATIECIEQDYEGKCHVCVVLDNDPGRDMGLLRQPGHRFFFDAEEVEPLSEEEAAGNQVRQKPSILVAGIGNIFLGDDAFGVEVVARMAGLKLPKTCEWPTSASGVLIWPMRCRMDTKPPSWWTRVRTGRLRARFTSSSPI